MHGLKLLESLRNRGVHHQVALMASLCLSWLICVVAILLHSCLPVWLFFPCGKWMVEGGACKVENGWWKMGRAKWKLGGGEWKRAKWEAEVESAKWKLDGGEWNARSGRWMVESGRAKWKVDGGNWKVQIGEWSVESGKCRVESGWWEVDSVKVVLCLRL